MPTVDLVLGASDGLADSNILKRLIIRCILEIIILEQWLFGPK
jgi:hypothetical protein